MNDGYIRLYINNTQIASHVNFDNDTLSINRLYFGAQGLDPGSSGSFYIDDLQAFRYTVVNGYTPPNYGDPPAVPAEPEWLESVYTYAALKPHAVTEVVREQPDGTTVTDEFTYDENGNMTDKPAVC